MACVRLHAVRCMLCPLQLVAFLDKLGEYRAPQPMNKKVTQLMASLYGLYDKKNSEIRWAGFALYNIVLGKGLADRQERIGSTVTWVVNGCQLNQFQRSPKGPFVALWASEARIGGEGPPHSSKTRPAAVASPPPPPPCWVTHPLTQLTNTITPLQVAANAPIFASPNSCCHPSNATPWQRPQPPFSTHNPTAKTTTRHTHINTTPTTICRQTGARGTGWPSPRRTSRCCRTWLTCSRRRWAHVY